MTRKPQPLTCTCCGGDAGKWHQFWNQDTGYGLCASCASWIASRGYSQEYLDETYGKEGLHREAPQKPPHKPAEDWPEPEGDFTTQSQGATP